MKGRLGPWGFWGPSFAVGFFDIYIDVVHVVDYDRPVVDDYNLSYR